MNNIYKEISTKTNGKFDRLKFSKIEFVNNIARVTVSCTSEDKAFANANKAELLSLIADICAFNEDVELVISDARPTAAELRKAVVEFTEKFNYISSAMNTITAEQTESGFTVSIRMHKGMLELAKSDYIPRLEEFLKNRYIDEIKLNVVAVEYSSGGVSRSVSAEKREYAIASATPIIGDLIPDSAQSVASVTEKAYNVIVCGVFAMPTAFVSKGGRKYERFLLYDGETSIQCRFNPENGKSIVNSDLINKPVCVIGNVDYDNYRNEATMFVNELSLCVADGLKATESVPAPKDYSRITPAPYLEYVQSSMFDKNAALPEILKGSFVVFDFETTGLSILYDKPTEIGAVKIVDGILQESFGTLIDPRRPIPPEVSEKTGITDDMVKGQPLFEDILPDFYKFSYGCSFVCHNIAFDFPFLLKGGNSCGLAFGDRKTYDTMALAPVALPGITKLTLDKVLEGLGLVNDNAHRAVSDAAATAKAFIAMNKIINK